MATGEAQDGTLATLGGPKISYVNVVFNSNPLLVKRMLLAAATATFASDTHVHY